MAMACKCDRCKRLFDMNEDGMVNKLHTYEGSCNEHCVNSLGWVYDLCPSCADSLSKWLKMYEVEETKNG